MDWAKITRDAEHLLTLDVSDISSYLEDSNLTSNEKEHVQTLWQDQNHTFMRTSVPDNKPLEFSFSANDKIGNWQIIKPLAIGGMAEVYQSERADGTYEQIAALKVMQATDTDRSHKFEVERQRLAQMEHPNISRIIDGGEIKGGYLFMVMEYVEGLAIDAFAEKHKFSLNEKLKLFSKVCDALIHAHSKLIIHQDIKAPNVMVNDAQDVRVIDFGISTDVSDKETKGSAFTLAAAAPEQLKRENISVGTDIFGLGALLNVLLTGEHASRDSDASMQPFKDLDPDLFAICEKCLRLNPEDRYSSVAGLKEDVKAFLQKKPVAARQGGRLYHFGKSLKRFPFAYGFASLAVLSMTIGTAASLKFASDTQSEMLKTEKALQAAEFQYERADSYLQGQTGYSEILLEAFGGDTDSMTTKLMEKWQAVHDDSGSYPARAASISFAAARAFHDRDDYQTSEQILSAWLETGYGSEQIRRSGEVLRAMNMHDFGNRKMALPRLKDSLKWMETVPIYPTAEKYAIAFRIAGSTMADDDISNAERLHAAYMNEADGKALDPVEQIESHAGLFQLQLVNKNYPAAIDSLHAILKVFEVNPDASKAVLPAARDHLAKLALYTVDDPALALKIAEQGITEDTVTFGESLATSGLYKWKAEALRRSGQFEEAKTAIGKSKELRLKFAGEHYAAQLAEDLILARILSNGGHHDEALSLIADLKTQWTDQKNDSAYLPSNLLLTQLDIMAENGEDISVLPDDMKTKLNPKALGDYSNVWRYKQCLKAGMENILSVNTAN